MAQRFYNRPSVGFNGGDFSVGVNRYILALLIIGAMAIVAASCSGKSPNNGSNQETGAIEDSVSITKIGYCGHGSKFPPAAVLKADETIVFTITVTNTSKAPIENVVVIDTVPEGMEILQGEASAEFTRIEAGEEASFEYELNSGDPELYIIPATQVEFSQNDKSATVTGTELYVDVQLTTSC